MLSDLFGNDDDVEVLCDQGGGFGISTNVQVILSHTFLVFELILILVFSPSVDLPSPEPPAASWALKIKEQLVT